MTEDIVAELADNWPAFTYILLMVVFSFIFFRERRRERKDIEKHLERLELLLARERRRES